MFIKKQNKSKNTQGTQNKDKKKLAIGLALLSGAFVFGVISYTTILGDEVTPPSQKIKQPIPAVNTVNTTVPSVNNVSDNNSNNGSSGNKNSPNNGLGNQNNSNLAQTKTSERSNSENVITPDKDVKLVGDLLKKAIEDIVKQQVDEMKEQLKQEMKNTAVSNTNTKKKISLPSPNETTSKSSNSSKVDFFEKISNKVFITSKFTLPDGEIILRDNEGNIIAKGEEYKGYNVRNIDEKYIYLEHQENKGKKGKKVIRKKISYTVMISGGN